MIPDPLHPAVVHFPIALSVLLALAVLGALLATALGSSPRRAWLWVVGTSALLSAAAWLAIETGQDQEDAVERVVPGQYIHEHEERAEALLYAALATLVLSGLGLLTGRRGAVARALSIVAAVVVLVAGYRVGSTGGALVYEHGAARAYDAAAAPAAPGMHRGDIDDD